jgi:hypothetical protein
VNTTRERRTKIDWSKHEVIKIETPDILVHYLRKPDTICGAVKFINTQGILAITGDYGNWIFCREFHPSRDGFVSDSYWLEKLRMCSSQKPTDFDPDETRKEIEERLEEEDTDEDDREYLRDILNQVDECEERYMVYAHDNLPSGRDSEYIPIVKKLNPWLEVIFDAFEEICIRAAQ